MKMKVHAILKRFLLCVEFKWTQFIRATPSWVAIELLNRSYSSGHFLNANITTMFLPSNLQHLLERVAKSRIIQ